ncbi:terpene synthase [Actinomadura sp. KC216]|uniref:terpene synthase family protein n=1 Tax=Actinomadura sp. KC216 TaxID=2530370 RepID=UPI001049AC2E|nr:terpene synthase family protein [Actinomadura sp. KC216]TDB91779.1 terpene synthase [Actinomadura sp. KC216]
MDPVPFGGGETSAAAEHGRICALAMECQRDLQECVDAYPDLFPSKPFDGRLFSAVALANAFGSPWATAADLRIAIKTSMWNFAADWQIDYLAGTRDEVQRLITGCLAVADGTKPAGGSAITTFLAEIVEDLRGGPASGILPVWRDQLGRWLAAMAREWEWKADLAAGRAAPPTFEDYLANADNFGTTWVNLAHWIHTGDAATVARVDELWAASQEVQRILRLLNDLATYRRDVEWGDLNALMLGVERGDVRGRIEEMVEHSRKLIDPLKDDCPEAAAYLERQIGFSVGFYGVTDYWGTL